MAGRRKKKVQKRTLFFMVLGVLLITGMGIFITAGYEKTISDSADMIPKTEQPDDLPGSEEQEWYLILVNQDHPVPENYQVDLLKLSNGHQVDSRIYPDLQRMFDACRAQGFELFVREGYRTHEEQKRMFDEKIEAFMEEGCSRKEAENLAKGWVAIPGTSEHELGLAVDINPEPDMPDAERVYTWLEDNSYKYGFIKRYPADKAAITGINNEPWHFRYVGIEAAKEMFQKGLCLEEYIEQNNKPES